MVLINNLIFVVGKNTTFTNVSEYVQKVVWSGRKGAAPRTIEVTLFDSETLGRIGTKVDVGEGQTCVLYDHGAGITLFQGMIMSERYTNKRQLVLKAYDVAVWLTNNKDSFTYKNQTADQIVRDCLNRLNIPVGTIAGTGYRIGELVKKGTTYWDVIEDALSQTYLATGARYYVYSASGRVFLKERRESQVMPVLDLTINVESYDYTRSIENTRTRLKMVTAKGDVKRTEIVGSLENKIGMFQEFESVDEKISDADINQKVQTFRTQKALIGQTLNVTCTGDSTIKSGDCVYVRLSNLGVQRVMFVEEDVHTYENGKHTMKLKLDFEKSQPRKQAAASAAPKAKTYKVGDIVNFHGGTHYTNSYEGARGYRVSAGKARITIINSRGVHPYHLIHTDNSSRVYGWVDKGSFD